MQRVIGTQPKSFLTSLQHVLPSVNHSLIHFLTHSHSLSHERSLEHRVIKTMSFIYTTWAQHLFHIPKRLHDVISPRLFSTQYVHKSYTSSTASLTDVFCCGVSDPSSATSSSFSSSSCPGAALRLVGKESSAASGHHVVAPPPL